MRTSTTTVGRRLLLLPLLLLASLAAWAQPSISSFSPGSGASGSSVVITGSGFTGVTSVRFGELSAVFTVNSASQITAVVPRAASTQLINVTTSAGYAFSAADFTVTRGSSVSYSLVTSNFAGVSGGANAAPAVADIDGNGRLDLLVGLADGTIGHYEQTTVNGTAFSNVGLLSTGSANIDMGTQATVAIVDLEGDGQLNLLLGRGNGTVSEYEQPTVGAGTFAFVRDNVSNISTTSNTATSMTDLDGDGNLELLVGKGDGITSHSEQRTPNTGTFDRIDTNFNSLQLSGNAAPFCVDLDGNGRIDILMGLNTGALYRYEQTAAGSFTVSQVSSSFNGITAGSNAKPCVTDIDGDGLLDLLVGRGDGTISRYEQAGTVPAPSISGFTPTSGPVGTSVTVSGTNLAGVSAVTVNGTAGTITGTPTTTSFTFTVGSGSTSGVIGVTTPGGTASSSGSFTVGVPNTAPTVLALSSSSVAENVAAGSVVGTFSTTDAQGGPFTYSLVAGAGSTDNGDFSVSGSSLTTNASPNYEVQSSYSIRVRTTDPGGLTFEQMFTISVTDVAEVPTVTTFTPTSGTVGTTVTINGTHFSDAGTVTVKFNGTTAATVTVNSNSQLTAAVPTGATTGTISVQNSDGTGTSSGTFTVVTPATVTTAAPATVTGSSAVLGGSVTSGTALTERGVVYVAGSGTPTTSNTKALTGTSTGSFSGTVNGLAGNTLYSVRAYAINGAGTTYGAVQTFTTGNNPPVAGDDSYTVNEDSGASPFSVLGNDTDPDAGTTLIVTGVTQPAGGAVTFTSTGVSFTPTLNFNGTTTFTYTIADGNGGTDTGTVTVTVTAVNDAPVVTVPGTQSTPQNTPFAFSAGAGNAITISDVDAGSGQLEIYLGASNGAVTLSSTAGLTFVSGSNGSGSFTFRGTLANVNTALNNMTFSPNSGFYGAASLQVQANDLGNTGTGGALTDSKTVAINVVQPVNQAPVVTVPATQSTPYNMALTFSSANGNALSVADADAGSGQLAIYLSVGYGTATLSTTAGLTFTSGSNGSGGFGFTGTLSAINAALNGLVFRSNTNYSGAASLQVQANDQGNTGSGGAKTDSKTVTINVAPNQAPVLTASSGSTTWSQGGAAVAVDAALTASDVDSPNLASATVSITTGFVSGQDVLAFTSANGITGSYAAGTGVLTLSGSATVASYQAALRSITYSNTNGAPTAGSRTVRFVASDGLASSAAVTKAVVVIIRPETTIVSGPGTLTNNSTVSFQFSSDQSPVDYTTAGNPGFAYTGNGANSNFGPLADGTYTLSVAAHNTSTGLTDATPATYTFTVDTQKPGATISSAGNTSGGSTTTSPIGFTVTFTEPVTSFSLAGISVSSGTKGNFVAVSSTQYTFDLTPAGPATITVSVAAGVAQDAATNANTAAPPYTLTYALPVTAAPAVSYPTGGSTIASTAPTYSGTAPAGSLVTVYVDNASIGTTTATAGGSWSFTQPTVLSQATHTVKATAQRSGYAVSAFSAANSFTVDTTAPSVPVVSSPADGSFVGTLRPAYSGSGAGGSTITVYVDNVSIGTTTIAAGGTTWSFTQPADLSQAAHTVKVTATDGVGNVSAFSAANIFTVDTTAPTVAVSSSVGSSGTTTATTPVPFTVTFNEPMSSFALTDITVSSGTRGSFVMVSASQYTFSVTPAGAGAIVVSVAAGVAQDRAGNNNVASPGPAFSLTYQPRPTVTALSAAAELPGMPITLTGTNFTSGSTVTVGGTTASVTYNSATALTATVPAGAAVGSAAVVVTTSSISSTSAPAFSVLKVYDATTSCLAGTGYVTTGDGAWHYLLAGGQVVAALRDTDADLGTVSVDLQATGTAGAVRQDGRGRYYLDRNFHLTASGGTFGGSSVQVRFYGLVSELSHLQTADASATYANLKATQYSGPNEDCDLNNNSATGESRVLPLTASTPGGGVAWFVAQATVADHFSEFYLTSSATPLPVQLVAFTAERRGSAVALAWRTASELNSARFEVERSTDGAGFVNIGQVAAQGSKSTATDYAFADAQALAALSYYRLRQVDLDGTAHYSPVRTVAAGPAIAPTLAAYPVPARAGQPLTVAHAPAGAAVEVFDAVGRRVAAATATPDGTATLDLPTGLPAGVYVMRSGSQTRRLVVE